jgi:hypothetical protein
MHIRSGVLLHCVGIVYHFVQVVGGLASVPRVQQELAPIHMQQLSAT